MKTLWGFIKFLIVCAFFMCIVGVITTISCIKKAQNHYSGGYTSGLDVNIPSDANEEDVSDAYEFPDVKPDVTVETPTSITWVPIESLDGSGRCVMLYFAKKDCCESFEMSVLGNRSVVNVANRKFLSAKVPDNQTLHKRFEISVFPTIMLLPKSGKGLKLTGEASVSKVLSLMNDTRFNGC